MFERTKKFFGKVKSVIPNLDPYFFHHLGSGGMITAGEITQKPYQYHPIVFGCTWTFCRNISRLPLYLRDANNPDDIIKEHPLLDLLHNPNPYMTQHTFLQAIILSLLLPSRTAQGKVLAGGQCFVLCYDAQGNKMDLTKGVLPTVMMPMNDKYITAKRAPAGKSGFEELKYWELAFPGYNDQTSVAYQPNEIIRIFQYNPYDLLAGLAQYTPAQIAIDQDVKASIFNTQLFENDAIPSGILSSDQELTREQMKDQMAHWYETYGGIGNARKIAILQKSLKYQHIGLTYADMQYKDLMRGIKDTIISTYNLNKIAIGEYENLNLATIKEGRRHLWEDAYTPMAELIVEAINSQFVRWLSPGLKLCFDYSVVPVLRPDYSEKVKTASVMVQDMFMPTEMACRLNDIPISQNDLKDYPWLKQNPAELKSWGLGLGNIFGTSGTSEEKSIIIKGNSPLGLPTLGASLLISEKKSLPFPKFEARGSVEPSEKRTKQLEFWDAYVKAVLDPVEKSYQKDLVTFFYSQRNRMQDNVDAWARKNQGKSLKAKMAEYVCPVCKTPTELYTKGVQSKQCAACFSQVEAHELINQAKADEEFVSITPEEVLLDIESENESLLRISKSHQEDQMKRSKEQLAKEGISWDYKDPTIAKFAKARAKFIKGINETSFKYVENKITDLSQEAMEENWTVGELAKEIKSALSEVGETRKGQSRTIARTEMGSIASLSRHDGFREAGIERHEWITAGDESVRDSHAEQNGDVVDVGDAFENGLMFPSESGGDPAEVINCFPAGMVAYGNDISAAYRSLYNGELVTIKTASGHELTGTPNHPILTARGFIPLKLLKHGDCVISGVRQEWKGFCNANIKNAPARIEKIFNSFDERGKRVRISSTNVNFYGDRPTGDVDIVSMNGELLNRVQSALCKPAKENILSFSNFNKARLFGKSLFYSRNNKKCSRFSPDDVVGSGSQAFSFFGTGFGHSQEHRLAGISRFDAGLDKSSSDNNSIGLIFPGHRQLGQSSRVVGKNTSVVQENPNTPHVDTAFFKSPENHTLTAIKSFCDGSHGFPFGIASDRIVDVSVRKNFSGHVYTLQSKKGIYISNGIISKNCRCVTVAVASEEPIDSEDDDGE